MCKYVYVHMYIIPFASLDCSRRAGQTLSEALRQAFIGLKKVRHSSCRTPSPARPAPGRKDIPMFDSIRDVNELLLLALLILVAIGYKGRKAGKPRRRKRRAQYRNLTRPGAAARAAGNDAGREPR